MQANLKAVTAAGIQKCRENGIQCDAVEVAYTACLLEEQQAWNVPAEPQQDQHDQQQQSWRLCTAAKLPAPVLEAMAERLRQHLAMPTDPATTATARLQVALERSFKQQQDIVEAEQSQQAAATARLASSIAYKKVNLQAACLPLYQGVFSQVVEYVCAAVGLESKASADPEARAQVSAAVEGVLPLSGLAYFLTLPAQERMQQLESVAAIAAGICLFNAHTGNAPSPLVLSADTQLLQAQRLLVDIQAASAQAEAGLDHYNRQEQHQHAPDAAATAATAPPPVLAAAAAAYLGISSGGSTQEVSAASPGSSSSSASSVPLGAVLFCCQAAVALRALCVDLSAGLGCCTQLHNELLSVLTQAAQIAMDVPGAAVLKESVFPLFESAGRMYQALRGELRLLLVRGRLWECACEALTAGSQQPGVPTVLGFTAKRRLGHLGSSRSSQAGSFSLLQGGPASSCRSSSVAGAARTSTAAPAAVIDLASLPADMEYVCPAAAMGWGVSQDDTAAAAAGGVTPVEEGCHAAAGAAEQQVLALNGVCPVSVASSVAAGAFAAAAGVEEGLGLLDRLLLGRMASPECGMIRYAGRLYGFCSPAAMASFVASPELILDAVKQAAHSTPLLLHTLGISAAAPLSAGAAAAAAGGGCTRAQSPGGQQSGRPASGHQQQGPSSAGGFNRGSSSSLAAGAGGAVGWRMPPLRGLLELLESTPLKVEASTQTVTHVVERLVDVNYEWNEWALRRRIIALANLRHKATHSTQTLLSHFRQEGSSQTWLPKQAAVQTRVNAGSSVPRKLRHVTGLRGPPDTKMKAVALELDVHGKGRATVKSQGGQRPL